MRIEALLLLGVGVFFGLVGTVYWFTAYEDGGTMMLVGTCLLGLLPGSYYFYWHHRMPARPEDRDDAKIEDGAGTIDSFPGSSIWPFMIGMSAFMITMGLVFGWWLALPGVGLLLTALAGVTAESRRGGNV